VERLLDDLEVVEFEEIEEDGASGSRLKRWHIFEFMARARAASWAGHRP
jgi:hypothetical protein